MGQQVDAGIKQALPTLLITISTTFISVLLTFLEIIIKWVVIKGGRQTTIAVLTLYCRDYASHHETHHCSNRRSGGACVCLVFLSRTMSHTRGYQFTLLCILC